MEIAEKNIKKAGMSKYVTMHEMNLKKSKKMPLEEMDLAIIDLGDPWDVLPQVRKMLKSSGSVVAICPTMNQLEKLSAAFVENEFTDIECTEHILRHIEAREGKLDIRIEELVIQHILQWQEKSTLIRKEQRKSELIGCN